MMKMKFTDGVEIETSGEYRVIVIEDGCYVVGHGMLCPVDSEDDGIRLIIKLMGPQ